MIVTSPSPLRVTYKQRFVRVYTIVYALLIPRPTLPQTGKEHLVHHRCPCRIASKTRNSTKSLSYGS
uniref:Uncharacterized protein n=1 Tax=Plectus sambesii TaxID=2011161 RepID=A0A914W0W5_9BILA